MKLSSSCDDCVCGLSRCFWMVHWFTGGEYIGVTLEMGEGGEGVQFSELLNLEIVLYILLCWK